MVWSKEERQAVKEFAKIVCAENNATHVPHGPYGFPELEITPKKKSIPAEQFCIFTGMMVPIALSKSKETIAPTTEIS